jgi:GNAT superfamily N-acetyltransferase
VKAEDHCQVTSVSEKEPIIKVCMNLASLDSAPAHALPPGFSLRTYRPGDEKAWAGIWQRADEFGAVAADSFKQEFGSDAAALGERMFFLFDAGGDAVGTASAWYPDDAHGPGAGRVHWVAIVPQRQGRGLSRPLLAVVLTRMKELGCRSAFLETQTVRVAAIRLYMEFGFVPDVRSEKERAGWTRLRDRIAPSALDGAAL